MSQPSSLSNLRPQVLALCRQQEGHYAPLGEAFELTKTADWSPECVQMHKPDLLVTASCDSYESSGCVDKARQMSIPSLYLMDGIIEWRNQWENPRFGMGGGTPYNQPVTTDKVACFGWASARTLEAWGAMGKCELVGAPRFDHYITRPVCRTPHGGPKRLLIATANTPAFTQEQMSLVEASLTELAAFLKQQTAWEPVWRLRRGLDEKLNLTDCFPNLRQQSLRDAFEQVDAVLTTPSTLALEAMLAGLPTGVLDYTNSPQYLPAAWCITAQAQIAGALRELEQPSSRRLNFQAEILYNHLECRSAAQPRLVALAEAMIAEGRAARSDQRPVKLDPRIIPVEFGGVALPTEHFDLAKLYPEHPILKNRDLSDLHRQLILLRQEIRFLRVQTGERKVGYWIKKAVNKAWIWQRTHRRRRGKAGAKNNVG
ncbi:MAG: hypothetical protein IH623_16410 [Verrucomicrobia bacterium]|nr:hypothetical protein [Verrucomicrobiota bacterium]